MAVDYAQDWAMKSIAASADVSKDGWIGRLRASLFEVLYVHNPCWRSTLSVNCAIVLSVYDALKETVDCQDPRTLNALRSGVGLVMRSLADVDREFALATGVDKSDGPIAMCCFKTDQLTSSAPDIKERGCQHGGVVFHHAREDNGRRDTRSARLES